MEKEEEEEMRGQHGAPRKAEAAAAVTVGGGNTHEVPRSALPRSHSSGSPPMGLVQIHRGGPQGSQLGAGDVWGRGKLT